MKMITVNISNTILYSLFISLIAFSICDKTKMESANASQQQGFVTVNIPGQGDILGSYGKTLWSLSTFMQFLSIPYAESPQGDLRFKLPVKRVPWPNILDGTRYGRRCPVYTHLNSAIDNANLEDCLNLCVYTKNLTTRWPVMFYVYGGGFYNGSNEEHPPQFLLEKDIVLVVPNFRIGALGWLSLNNENMPGNAPVGDLLMALQWVQHYIHIFGGDPSKVTIFGQSAGAALSGALLITPKREETHFHRSIVQSGSIFAPWAINKNPIQQTENVCKLLKCTDCIELSAIYNCLRNASVSQILDVTKSAIFGIVIDDYHGILPNQIETLFNQIERINLTIPLMTGFNKHDGSFILAEYYDTWKHIIRNLSKVSVRDFSEGLLGMVNDNTGLSNNLLRKLLFPKDLWRSNHHKKALPAYIDLASIIYMKSPVITLANTMTKKKLAPVYLYTFDFEGSNTRFGYEMDSSYYPFEGGVHHSNENLYLFPTYILNENDTKMAQKMVDLWTSFAITGAPIIPEVNILRMQDEMGPYFHINVNITVDNNIYDELTTAIDDPENEKLIKPQVEF